MNELAAISDIRKKIIDKFPFAGTLLLPTKAFLVSEIKPHKSITKKFKSLSSRFRIGSQFEWLARFAEQHQICDFELCIQKNGLRPRSPVISYLRKFLIEENGNFKLGNSFTDKDLEIFQYFYFPVFFLTKLQMLDIAKKNDFYDIMLNTWFCHRPKHGHPCGLCHPCADAMEEGFKFRLSTLAKLRYHLRKYFQKIKESLPVSHLNRLRNLLGRKILHNS